MIVQLYVVGADPDGAIDGSRGWVAMLPSDARPIGVTMVPLPGGGPGDLTLAMAALATPNATRVKRRFFVAGFGQEIQPLIGRRIGAYIGQAGTVEGTVMVFEDVALGEEGAFTGGSMLLTAEAQGHG